MRLVSCPVVKAAPWEEMIIFAPRKLTSSVQAYMQNCISGLFRASSRSALAFRWYT